LLNASFAEISAGNAWLSISAASSFSLAIILPASLLSIVFSTTNSFFIFAVLEAIFDKKKKNVLSIINYLNLYQSLTQLPMLL